MPSLGNGVTFGLPSIRSRFVSFSQNSSGGWDPSGAGPTSRTYSPRSACLALIRVPPSVATRSEEHTSELQSHVNLVCRLLLEKKKDLENPTSSNHHALTTQSH